LYFRLARFVPVFENRLGSQRLAEDPRLDMIGHQFEGCGDALLIETLRP
jgi:hypothetical protein